MKLSGLKIVLIICLFFCSATISKTLHAQEFPHERGAKPKMAREPEGAPGFHGILPFLRLVLTPDQQKDLLDIFDKYQAMKMAYADGMMTSDQKLADIVEADSLDEGSARAVIKEQATVREEMMILEIKMNNEIKGVLSSEQLERLNQPGAGRPEGPFPPLGE